MFLVNVLVAALDKIVLRLFVAHEWMCQPFFDMMSMKQNFLFDF